MNRQSTYCTRKPPSVGPSAGATSDGTPKILNASPRSCGGKAVKSIAVPSGRSAPPPSPCRMRKKISAFSEGASPQSADAVVNAINEPT